MYHLLILSEGPWGSQVGQHIAGHAPSTWEVLQGGPHRSQEMSWGVREGSPILRHLPSLGQPLDLLLVLAEGGELMDQLSGLVEMIKPEAVLAPVEAPDWFPANVKKRLEVFLKAQGIPYAFPSPFCALSGDGCKPIAAFARCFGRPQLKIISSGGRIEDITVVTDTPCGFACQATQELAGVPVDRAESWAQDCQTRCPRALRGWAEFPPYLALSVRLALEPFEKVVEAHRQALLDYALAWTKEHDRAEDFVQEALLRAYRAYHQFTPGTNLRAWLRCILANVIRYEYQRHSEDPQVLSWGDLSPEEENFLAQEVPPQDQPEPAFFADSLSPEMEKALNSLSPPLRTVLWLDAVEGLSSREIAAMLGIQIGAVKMRLRRARLQLQAVLEGTSPGNPQLKVA